MKLQSYIVQRVYCKAGSVICIAPMKVEDFWMLQPEERELKAKKIFVVIESRCINADAYISQKLKTHRNWLCITEVSPSIALYGGVNPIPMCGHTAINTRKALL